MLSPIPNVDSHVQKLVPKPSHYNKSDEALFFGMARLLFWDAEKPFTIAYNRHHI